jgi:hypothetical protein
MFTAPDEILTGHWYCGNAVTPPASEVIGSALVEAITGETLSTRWELAA